MGRDCQAVVEAGMADWGPRLDQDWATGGPARKPAVAGRRAGWAFGSPVVVSGTAGSVQLGAEVGRAVRATGSPLGRLGRTVAGTGSPEHNLPAAAVGPSRGSPGTAERVGGMAMQRVLDRHKAWRCERNVERTQLPSNHSWHTGWSPLAQRRESPLAQRHSLLGLEPVYQRGNLETLLDLPDSTLPTPRRALPGHLVEGMRVEQVGVRLVMAVRDRACWTLQAWRAALGCLLEVLHSC